MSNNLYTLINSHARPLLMDGAMGSLLQDYSLGEEDFRGNYFSDSPVLLKGNNDVLVVTRPDVVADVHRRYLEAGADLISTNTFSAQRVSQQEYRLGAHVRAFNLEAARIARAEADRMTALTPDRPRYVLGDVGPTSRMLSMSDNADDPAARSITFDELCEAYTEQIDALAEGGVDAILVETIFDTLNAKAAIAAYLDVLARRDMTREELPLMLSMTVSDASGRTLSGQTIEAFCVSTAHGRPVSVGMNCGLGAEAMIPYLRRMREALCAVGGDAAAVVSCHPNAGLPNAFGGYDDTPDDMVRQMRPMLTEGLTAIIGGCCGTTPDHIRAMRGLIDEVVAEGYHEESAGNTDTKVFTESDIKTNIKTDIKTDIKLVRSHYAGLEAFNYGAGDFVAVGERCNVAGSRKFLRLINEKSYDEALDIARTQIEKGAMVVDVNMDDGLLDALTEVTHFLNLLASDPAVARVPIMIDSSRFEVIEAGLKCCQGKCIVNSISLKQGEAEFLRMARACRRLGAAVIVMCFDEEGQATDYDRRVAICARAHRLLTEEVGMDPTDIIFDPNVLTIATGMAEHADYARDFIRATAWVSEHLPGTRVSGGLSNLSFAFRGNNYIREAMHSVFLHFAREVGMGMAIMNPATAIAYDTIDPTLREAIADVVLHRGDTDADTERLMGMAQVILEKQQAAKAAKAAAAAGGGATPAGGSSASGNIGSGNTSPTSPADRLQDAIIKGITTHLADDLTALINEGKTPLDIISGPLMAGMNEVGRRFGAGEMFLPQVVKTARTMKRAVEVLEPYMDGAETASTDAGIAENEDAETAADSDTVTAHSAGRILLATVKGDVHDIGKNIVGVVLACNGYEVIDLGVMVPAADIVQTALERKVDIVCLSGLITPSLDEMCRVATALEEAGARMPIFVGGATTSEVHTAVRLAPLYSGGVFHLRDAAQNPVLAHQLLDPAQRGEVMAAHLSRQQRVRMAHQQREQRLAAQRQTEAALGELTPLDRRFACDWESYVPARPPHEGQQVHAPIGLGEIVGLIDWEYFHWAWRVKADTDEGRLLRSDADALLAELMADPAMSLRAVTAFYPARSTSSAIRLSVSKVGHPTQCPCCTETVSLATPRQDAVSAAGRHREQCLSLCDYVSPLGGDYLGAFAVTVSEAFVARLEALKTSGHDDYALLLLQTVGDRLAEAGAEWLSRELKDATGWGGIRPAVGYPSLPDQSAMFTLARLIDYSAVGITLTENGAMYPQSSVSGIYIAHPDARYFTI